MASEKSSLKRQPSVGVPTINFAMLRARGPAGRRQFPLELRRARAAARKLRGMGGRIRHLPSAHQAKKPNAGGGH